MLWNWLPEQCVSLVVVRGRSRNFKRGGGGGAGPAEFSSKKVGGSNHLLGSNLYCKHLLKKGGGGGGGGPDPLDTPLDLPLVITRVYWSMSLCVIIVNSLTLFYLASVILLRESPLMSILNGQSVPISL